MFLSHSGALSSVSQPGSTPSGLTDMNRFQPDCQYMSHRMIFSHSVALNSVSQPGTTPISLTDMKRENSRDTKSVKQSCEIDSNFLLFEPLCGKNAFSLRVIESL